MAKHGSFSSLFNVQSKSINFNIGHSLAKYQGYSLTFLAKNGSFSSLFNVQSKSINFNIGHSWAKYQGYSLTCCPNIAHFNHFSMLNQNQSISMLVIFGQTTKAIALLFGRHGSFSSPFNVKSKSINFIFGHLWAKCQDYSLTFWPKMPQFHHFNLQSKSITLTFGHLCAKYQGYSLTFRPNMAHFHHCSMFNQNQSISIVVIFGQNTMAIALLFGQKLLIFITFHC